MKYTIYGFSQKVLVELGIDGQGVLVLRWFVDFLGAGRMVPVDYEGKRYYWIKYQSVIDDMPILGTENKRTIAALFDRLVSSGIMEKYVKKDGGTFTCFRLNESIYDSLISGGGCCSNDNGGAVETATGVPPKQQPKDPSTNKDLSTKNKEIEFSSACAEIFQYFKEITGRTFDPKAKGNRDLVRARMNEGYGVADFKTVIDNQFRLWGSNPKMVPYLRPATLFSNGKDRHFEAYLGNVPATGGKQLSEFEKGFFESVGLKEK